MRRATHILRHTILAGALPICLAGSMTGCGAETTAPPQLTSEQRQSVKDNLTQLRARVTAETSDSLYLSLRNTHVEVHEFGGVVDGARGARADLQDFGAVSEAVARPFLAAGELDAFKQHLRQSLSPNSSTTTRAEYGNLAVTLTHNPLRLVFTLRRAAE